MSIKLIVGLQNPGAQYAMTRHNAGGWFAIKAAEIFNASFKKDMKYHADVTTIDTTNFKGRIILPNTYMNRSGQSVRAIMQFFKILPEEILVAHDELDIEPGRIKLKIGGGHGGHNGLRDIQAQIGTQEFYRLRIGIGHPGHKDQVSDYVLSKPSPDDKTSINNAIQRSLDALPMILKGEFAKAMNEINN